MEQSSCRYDEIERDLSGSLSSKRLARLESLLDDSAVTKDVIQVSLSIENVPATITEYRNRERHLEELLKALREDEASRSELTQVLAFRHILGSLYVNFEKFWGPTVRIIGEILAQSRFESRLKRILLSHLKDTNDIIYNASVQADLSTAEDRPDHILHRNFLFQLLAKCPDFVEANNVMFMGEFFRFVEKEMLVSPFLEKFTRLNLEQQILSTSEDVELGEEPVQEKKPTGRRKRSKVPESLLKKRKSRETFITVAKIIQSFKQVDAIHRHEELKDFILNLLCCRDASVQRAAFNCYLAFNDSDHIKPYIDKILKIMNDKKVRSEITSLSLEGNSDLILPEHRPLMIRVLLRLLYGKMIGQIGRKSSGRDKADLRKTLVMRFIASCTTEEILYFFNLLFEPLFPLTDIPYDHLKQRLEESICIQSYIPPNKLQAMLGSLSAFMHSIAHLQTDTLPYVLKLINIITFYVVHPLEDPKILAKLNNKSIDTLKALKRECMNIVSEFFRIFEYYNFKQEELDFLFEFLVWPSLPGFIDKNHATVTPMLKLIESFACNRIYHKLFVKRNRSNRDDYILKHIVELYSDSKTARPVVKFLASIIADLLVPDRHIQSEDIDGDDTIKMLSQMPLINDIDAIIPTYDKSLYKVDETLKFSQEMILSSIPRVFDRLKKSCQEFIDKKDIEHRIENDELLVLSTLSEFLKDSDQSLLGAKLLLSSLAHQKKADLILNTLRTSQVLLRQVKTSLDPSIVMYVADMISYQRNIEQRKELCNVVDVLAVVDQNLKEVSRITRLMNATSEEFIDSPDLVKWNEGFQSAFEYLDNLTERDMNNPGIIRSSFILLIHQSCYIMDTVDRYEFSIRENCSIFYEKISETMKMIDKEKNSDLLRLLIDDILLDKFVKKGMRETNDTIKHTYMAVLRTLAINCNSLNNTLNELFMFCSDNQDTDFWLNIRHIQLHSRSRALARLVADERLEKVSPRTLSSYFMPIAGGFLFSKNFKSVSGITDNSIKLIGIICRHLNWMTYESTLSYYLGLLTKANSSYQKTNIKLITEILRNFNFDLRACDEAMQHEEENLKLEKRMRKRRGVDPDGISAGAISADAPSGRRLNPSTAKMVYHSVTKKLIPRLNSCLHEMTSVEFQHDKNMANYLPEKDEIKRIPLAYAIVQLLNLLPGRFVLFRDQLPSLFLKLSSFLKSKNDQVRKAARSTLIKLMNFVGPAYLPDLLRIMKQNLDKGFLVHVLNYTVHSILEKLPLHYGDLDCSAHELVDSCMQEIFGKPSEDKDIAQILAKTSEAKKTKSFETLFILSSNISVDKLDYLMTALKNILKTVNEPRTVNKLSLCLQRTFTGLSQNNKFPLERLFAFVQATIEEALPNFKVAIKTSMPDYDQAKRPLREDRYLIEKERPRNRIKSKINERGNYHMIVENALKLLLMIFERNKELIKRKKSHQATLDGFIRLLSTCLGSSSPRCVTRSLKCIYFIAQAKSDLPSFATKCNSIVRKIFILLSHYNGVGMVHGDNFDMIGMCFKTLTLLLLRCEHVELTEGQVRAALSYIEQDINDVTRQATAFHTLHSMLKKQCNSPELPDIMSKIADLLVTSEDDSVRSLSIKIWQTYLLKYDLEPKTLQNHMARFLRQIDYKHIDGRKSVLRMLTVVVTEFPEKLLRDYFELFFHLLAQRVVNEESKEVRDIVGKLLVLLIQRLPDQQTYLLNRFVLPWASNTKFELKHLGVKLMTIFIEANQELFQNDKNRLKTALNIIFDSLEASDVESSELSATTSQENEESEEEQVVAKSDEIKLASIVDKLQHSSLKFFLRMLNKNVISCIEAKYMNQLKKIWQNISSKTLTSWYLPNTLVSCELYLIFIKETKLGQALNVEDPATDNYLNWNAKRIVRTLCDRYITLLDRVDESTKLFAFITESMILLGQFIAASKATRDFEASYKKTFTNNDPVEYMLSLDDLPNDGFAQDHLPYSINEAKKRLDLMWLSIKIVMQARKEAALFRLSKYYRREFVLQWTAAIAQQLGSHRLMPYAFLFVMTPVRELTDKNKGKISEESLQRNSLLMSEDLLKFIKGLLGVETFSKIYSKIQLHYTKRRVTRKKTEALIRVNDQARGVKRKMKQRKSKDTKRKKNLVKVIGMSNGRKFKKIRSK